MIAVKRIACTGLAVFMMSACIFPLSVHAEAETGKWVLTDVVVDDGTGEYTEREEYSGGGMSGFSSTTATYSPGSLVINNAADYYDEQFKDSPIYHTQYDYTTTFLWEEPPQEFSTENIRDLKLTVSGSITGLNESRYFYNDMYLEYHLDAYYPASGTLNDIVSPANMSVSFENPSVTKEVFIDKDYLRGEEGATLTIEVYCGSPLVVEYIYEYRSGTAAPVADGSSVINTEADAGSGETPYSVPKAAVLGITAVAALAGAAGAASAAAGTAEAGAASSGEGEEGQEEEEKESSFRMYVYKDFGNKIRYDQPAVSVYARMAEVKPDGREVERLDLTERIQIASAESCLKVGNPAIAGNYMGAAVSAESVKGAENPTEAVIRFTFSGEGGIFQNNMKFYLVGDPYIEYTGKHDNQIMVLAGSGGTYELPFKPVNFTGKPECTLEEVEFEGFVPEIVTEKDGKQKIVITDRSQKPEAIERFMDPFRLTIVAKSEHEECRSPFEVVLCYEGLLADFAGAKKEIKGYFDRKTGQMGRTAVAFRLGLWNVENEELEYVKPDDLAFTYSDESGVCEIIGLEADLDSDRSDREKTVYNLKAQKSFPSSAPVKGLLSAMCRFGEAFYEYSAEIPLMPDIQEYDSIMDTEKEYQNCLYMIDNYLPTEQAAILKTELETKRILYAYGAGDYQIYRRYVWERAQYYLMEQHRDYMREAAFYDDMIKVCDMAVFIGNIAFEAMLMPIGGPLAGFLISNAKDLFIALVNMYQTNGELTLDGVMSYLTGVLGGLDGVFSSTPSPSEIRKLSLWLAGYFTYRIFYNKYYVRNENNQINSWSEALLQAFKELGIKTVMAGFVARYLDEDQVINKNPYGYSKDADGKLMKPITDAGDAVVSKADDALGALAQFLDDIVDGKIVLPWA